MTHIKTITALGTSLSLLLVALSPTTAWAKDMEPRISLWVSPQLSPAPSVPGAPANSLKSFTPDCSVSAAYLLAIGPTLGSFGLGLGLLGSAVNDQRDGIPATFLFGFGFMGLGIVVGPSLGHFYAGEFVHGLITSSLRLGGLIGSLAFFNAASGSGGVEGSESEHHTTYRVAGSVLGIATLGLVVYDFIDAGFAVKRRIAKQRAGLASLRVAPLIATSAKSGSTYGLSASMRF